MRPELFSVCAICRLYGQANIIVQTLWNSLLSAKDVCIATCFDVCAKYLYNCLFNIYLDCVYSLSHQNWVRICVLQSRDPPTLSFSVLQISVISPPHLSPIILPNILFMLDFSFHRNSFFSALLLYSFLNKLYERQIFTPIKTKQFGRSVFDILFSEPLISNSKNPNVRKLGYVYFVV
jgi:hypothetical protein